MNGFIYLLTGTIENDVICSIFRPIVVKKGISIVSLKMPKVKSIYEKFWKMNGSMNILVGEF